MAELTTEELEREIVVYDKQKLISYCLKLFDTNQRLVDTNKALHKAGNKAAEATSELSKEIIRLKKRTLWQVLNERIENRIKTIRERRSARVESFARKLKY